MNLYKINTNCLENVYLKQYFSYFNDCYRSQQKNNKQLYLSKKILKENLFKKENFINIKEFYWQFYNGLVNNHYSNSIELFILYLKIHNLLIKKINGINQKDETSFDIESRKAIKDFKDDWLSYLVNNIKKEQIPDFIKKIINKENFKNMHTIEIRLFFICILKNCKNITNKKEIINFIVNNYKPDYFTIDQNNFCYILNTSFDNDEKLIFTWLKTNFNNNQIKEMIDRIPKEYLRTIELKYKYFGKYQNKNITYDFKGVFNIIKILDNNYSYEKLIINLINLYEKYDDNKIFIDLEKILNKELSLTIKNKIIDNLDVIKSNVRKKSKL